jgi:anti-sigma factor RsiW
MDRKLEKELMRLLHGELPAERARALRERLAGDPALAAAYRRLEAAWSGLDLPPAAPPPPGFAGRVMAQAREAARDPLAGPASWGLAPTWVRATAGAALVAGLVAGVGLGGVWSAPAGAEAFEATDEQAEAEIAASGDDGSLAESYWNAVEGIGEAGAAEPAPSESLP